MGRRKFKRRILNKNKKEVGKSTEPIDLLNKTTSLSYAQSLRMVEITQDNKQFCLNMQEELQIIEREEMNEDEANLFTAKGSMVPVPDVNIQCVEDDEYPWWNKDQKLPSGYRKYREKTFDELDEEIEYDIDEEDIEWLKLMNAERTKGEISKEQFIYVMNRLEKESYFQLDTKQQEKSHSNDEEDDAICCICLDGECVNSNVILFCDMCNLAVHQECYGVPYIPEGQWLCRKCIQSPSNAVSCALCPNKYGAFKQTDDNKWAHMICAIWIPEVHFANTVFLEPIIGIENIESARRKLMCYICRKRNEGACIQCDKTNCYTAFHVTCAQQAGLYMNIQDPNLDSSNNSNDVKKVAYCDIHSPVDTTSPHKDSSKVNDETLKREQAKRMKKARKILAERQPTLLMPQLSQKTRTTLLQKIKVDNKQKFLQLCINYWLLKRKLRSGVPLIRRLQTAAGVKSGCQGGGFTKLHKDKIHHVDDKFKSELKEQQLFCWKRLRQDLERARLLMELIRKRERTKRDFIRMHETITNYQLKPFQLFLLHILDKLREFDKTRIFHEPVKGVAGYYDYIKDPMDFSKMQVNIEKFKYSSFKQFEADFSLIISNCLSFNKNNQYYLKIATKLRDQAKSMLAEARKKCEQDFEQDGSGVHTDYKQHINEAATDCANEYVLLCSSTTKQENTVLSEFIKTEGKRQLSIIKDNNNNNEDIETKEDLNVKNGERKLEEQEEESDFKINNSTVNSSNNSINSLRINYSGSSSSNGDGGGNISENNNNNSISGVGRRTSVLFKKKKGMKKMPVFDSQGVKRNEESLKEAAETQQPQNVTMSVLDGEVYLVIESDEDEVNTDTEESDAAEDDDDENVTYSLADKKTFLEPLNVVWGKLPGYPWWPAMIVNPLSIKSDLQAAKLKNYTQPSTEMLKVNDSNRNDYLVYFFERKTPWHWIATPKLKEFDVNDKTYTNFKRVPKYMKNITNAYKAALNVNSLLKEVKEPSNGKVTKKKVCQTATAVSNVTLNEADC